MVLKKATNCMTMHLLVNMKLASRGPDVRESYYDSENIYSVITTKKEK